MPTYQYRCTECGHAFEEFQSFTDDALTRLPVCGGRLRKVFNAVGVVFKGSGFYRNDSRTVGRSPRPPARPPTRTGPATSSSSSSTSGVRLRVRLELDPARRVRRPRAGTSSASSTSSTTAGRRARATLWRGSARPVAPRLPSGHGLPPTARRPRSGDRERRTPRPCAVRVLARRRPLAAVCAGVAVLAGVARRPAPARADRAGRGGGPRPRLGHGPRRATTWSTRRSRPTSLPPVGSTPRAVGRTLAAPVRAGEPVTDVRLVGPSLVDGLSRAGRAPGPGRGRRGRGPAAGRRPRQTWWPPTRAGVRRRRSPSTCRCSRCRAPRRGRGAARLPGPARRGRPRCPGDVDHIAGAAATDLLSVVISG